MKLERKIFRRIIEVAESSPKQAHDICDFGAISKIAQTAFDASSQRLDSLPEFLKAGWNEQALEEVLNILKTKGQKQALPFLPTRNLGCFDWQT